MHKMCWISCIGKGEFRLKLNKYGITKLFTYVYNRSTITQCVINHHLIWKKTGGMYLYCVACRGKTQACRAFCLLPPWHLFYWRFLFSKKGTKAEYTQYYNPSSIFGIHIFVLKASNSVRTTTNIYICSVSSAPYDTNDHDYNSMLNIQTICCPNKRIGLMTSLINQMIHTLTDWPSSGLTGVALHFLRAIRGDSSFPVSVTRPGGRQRGKLGLQ